MEQAAATENTATATQKARGASAMTEKYLTFHLADEEYGLEILKVKEIIGLLSITSMPRTPDYIRGVINLRGKVVPVMDLRVKFGMDSHEDTDETCIIVVDLSQDGNDVQVGILVDSVSEVLDIEETEIENTPSFGSEVNTDFIQGMGKAGQKVVILLDIDRVLSHEDFSLAKKTSDETGS